MFELAKLREDQKRTILELQKVTSKGVQSTLTEVDKLSQDYSHSVDDLRRENALLNEQFDADRRSWMREIEEGKYSAAQSQRRETELSETLQAICVVVFGRESASHPPRASQITERIRQMVTDCGDAAVQQSDDLLRAFSSSIEPRLWSVSESLLRLSESFRVIQSRFVRQSDRLRLVETELGRSRHTWSRERQILEDTAERDRLHIAKLSDNNRVLILELEEKRHLAQVINEKFSQMKKENAELRDALASRDSSSSSIRLLTDAFMSEFKSQLSDYFEMERLQLCGLTSQADQVGKRLTEVASALRAAGVRVDDSSEAQMEWALSLREAEQVLRVLSRQSGDILSALREEETRRETNSLKIRQLLNTIRADLVISSSKSIAASRPVSSSLAPPSSSSSRRPPT